MNTDLITAAKDGDMQQVMLCVQNGADPKLWNSQALSEAAIHNHVEIVKFLTPLSDPNADCAVALRNAFLHNNTDVINFLWNQVDHELIIQHTQYVQRPSPFQLACQYGFYEQALSLFKHPLHRDMLWKAVFYVPKISNDPLCWELWDHILTRVKELGEDPYHFAVSPWHDKPLPGLNILKIMARHLTDNIKSSQRFLESVAQNWASGNHVSAVFPIFEHMFDDFDDDTKQSIIAKTIAYDPLLAHALIHRCPTTQFLCTSVVKEALHADREMLIDMIGVWKTHPYYEDEREFQKLENTLIERIYDAPEKVWCVVGHFKQFLTPKVIQVFIWLQNDHWTAQMCAHTSDEDLQSAKELFDDKTQEYFDEYQNRVQHAALTHTLSDCIGKTVVRKI